MIAQWKHGPNGREFCRGFGNPPTQGETAPETTRMGRSHQARARHGQSPKEIELPRPKGHSTCSRSFNAHNNAKPTVVPQNCRRPPWISPGQFGPRRRRHGSFFVRFWITAGLVTCSCHHQHLQCQMRLLGLCGGPIDPKQRAAYIAGSEGRHRHLRKEHIATCSSCGDLWCQGFVPWSAMPESACIR